MKKLYKNTCYYFSILVLKYYDCAIIDNIHKKKYGIDLL